MNENSGSSSRELLLTTAARHFSQFGIAATNLKRIASEVGISAPAIYYHFESKEALAFEAFHWAMSRFDADVRSRVRAADPTLRLAEIVLAHVRFKLEHPDIASAYTIVLGNHDRFTEFTPEHKAALRSVERDYYSFVHEVVDAGVAEGQFVAVASSVPVFAILSMCEFVTNWYRPDGPFAIDTVARTFAGYALAIVGVGIDETRRADAWLEKVPA